MLARLTTNTARLVDVQFAPSRFSDQDEECESSLVVDLHALRVLLPPIPENAWHRVAGMCGWAVGPVCTNIHRTLSSDLEDVTQLLLDLELRHEPLNDALPVGLLNQDGLEAITYISDSMPNDSHPSKRPALKRPRLTFSIPEVIESTHTSAPSIVITFSPPQPRETSCRIPYQNQAFGCRLTVPNHPVFNKLHPPMVLGPCSLPQADDWQWNNGHWEAVLPTLMEQARRGIFSKPFKPTRKKSRVPCVNS
ncbi:hypothetical protein GALMADRAFT_374479 [Galerina marginata CBS 339.88]|uniref:Uncharacterized protein n=1 Tax=Galerina marginata (strain CBS 339.88) TaxID=685588 RepID=A0A067TR20_GALM3|nr:hypothetical protein GALMADRAFT_374479 [Galerina marginata CBS 339.88]